MSGVTEKHAKFINTAMEMSNICNVPGIGYASAEKLGNKGYFLACQLFMRYLQLEGSQFTGWLQGITGNKKDAELAYIALEEWNKQFGSHKGKVENVDQTQ
ncbi:barrier-to-autointegration factor-like [Mytilus galloprovincialis]|uniref:barrier-to-autointegration factor-like n=1 Tax=Mytilus galloprovincialis TaxID=29158 RepID=UPI003F7C9F9C